jgi:hypothetical protein
MFALEQPVWNVFDQRVVEPQSFSFDDHIKLILGLLHEAGAERAMLQQIERCA